MIQFVVVQAREMMENCAIENPNNDDNILQCCLLFQRKGELFTFDHFLLLYLQTQIHVPIGGDMSRAMGQNSLTP